MGKRKGGEYGYAASWCCNYRSPNEGTECSAGIPFARWQTTPFNQQPCFLNKDGTSKPGAASCPKLRLPTAAEIAQHDVYVRRRGVMLFAALGAIEPWRAKQAGRGGNTKLECPVCKGVLHVSMARNNGHLSAKCETKDCVEFIQ